MTEELLKILHQAEEMIKHQDNVSMELDEKLNKVYTDLKSIHEDILNLNLDDNSKLNRPKNNFKTGK